MLKWNIKTRQDIPEFLILNLVMTKASFRVPAMFVKT